MAEGSIRSIQVYSDAAEKLHCMKCARLLHSKDLAMLIRTSPKNAFSPWCPNCTWEIIHAAATELLGDDPDPVAVLF